MPYVQVITDEKAQGQVKEDLDFIADSYANALWDNQFRAPAPDVYRVSSIVPAWLHYIAYQNSVLTEGGKHYLFSDAVVPRLSVLFAAANYTSCFH